MDPAAIAFFLVINGTPVPSPMSKDACFASRDFYEMALKEEMVRKSTMPPQLVICLPTGEQFIPVWSDFKRNTKKG